MNIKITYNWLLEYLDTDADPYEIQKYLSLSGPSVEKVEKIGNDYVFELEITSNRIDMASVFGIAQECLAVLPQFGKKARLKLNPLNTYKFTELSFPDLENAHLDILITDKSLCPRFTAVVMDIDLGTSPDLMADRLIKCGVKSIDNIVDVSNYLMLALGQPVHVFDYDKIIGRKMVMRNSLPGEKIITLDGKEIILPGDDIVMEDGSKRLIDLCGIMGGQNSAISKTTKRIVLFVQTYNKQKIRRTSMLTGQRTIAATYFEKGLDPERVEPTIVNGAKLLEQYAKGKIISPLYDIYLQPYESRTIVLYQEDIVRIIGVDIDPEKVTTILESLGFIVKILPSEIRSKYEVTIPSFRSSDVAIKEDLIEEIARIYGYFKLPNNLPPCAYVSQPKNIEKLFEFQSKIKHYLKDIGLNEVMNYSMISQELITALQLDPNKHLCLANTISEEIRYLRTSLMPSLARNIRDNQGKKENLRFFEISKVYFPAHGQLPEEIYKLGLALNSGFFDLKGIVQALLSELNIEKYEMVKSDHPLLLPHIQSQLIINNKTAGHFGQLKDEYQLALGSKIPIFLAEFDFETLIANAKVIPVYHAINPYALIKLDLTIKTDQKTSFVEIKETAYRISKLLDKVEVANSFRDNLTLRFYFTDRIKNITEEEAKKELEKIRAKILTS